MPKQEEIAAVVANGRRFETWESISIEGQFAFGEQGVARTMTLSVAEVGDIQHGFGTLRLKPGDTAQGYLAGRLAISGFVAIRQVRYNATQHGVQIVVISRAQSTVPSTVDAQPGQYSNATLQQIASAVFGKVGVGFRIEGSPPGADKIFERVSEHLGESRFSFIERLARFRTVFMRDDENGDIVASRGTQGDSVAQLVEGKNILDANIVMDNHEALDQTTMLAQNFGSDRHWGDDASQVSATADVGGLPTNGPRPFKDVCEENADAGDCQMRAKTEASVNALTQIDARIIVPGWLMDDGSLWIDHIGKPVTLFSPMLLPTDQMTLALKSVRHMQDSENGTRTELGLCLPNALGGGADQSKLY